MSFGQGFFLTVGTRLLNLIQLTTPVWFETSCHIPSCKAYRYTPKRSIAYGVVAKGK
jgi:hypothetical protein